MYYDRLQRVRTHGEWEEWIAFFLQGVVDVAASTIDATREIVAMIERDRATVTTLGKGAATAARLHALATRQVIFTARHAIGETGLTGPPVYAALRRLQDAGILEEVTGNQRNRIYAYREYLTILNAGTEARA